MVGDEFSRKPYAIAVQQGSPLKDQFNNAILLLLNKRKLEKLKETWWNLNPERIQCEKQDNQSDGISIHNIGRTFFIYPNTFAASKKMISRLTGHKVDENRHPFLKIAFIKTYYYA